MCSATCLRLKNIQTTTPQLVPKLSKSSLDGSKTCLSKGPESAFMEEPFAWPPGLRDWSGNDSTYVFVSRALYVFGYLFEAEKYTNNNSPTGPKIFTIIPRWLQNPPPNGSKMVLGNLLEPSWLWFFLAVSYFCLQLASWSALGRLRAPKKVIGERPLDGPRPPRRLVSACLGAK